MNQPLRIVAADDDPDSLQALAAALRALGHQVDAEARPGQQLVERCRVVRPNLIVADIDMPRLDGIAAVREVCREGPTQLVTAHRLWNSSRANASSLSFPASSSSMVYARG
jgi:response regulator NasT